MINKAIHFKTVLKPKYLQRLSLFQCFYDEAGGRGVVWGWKVGHGAGYIKR